MRRQEPIRMGRMRPLQRIRRHRHSRHGAISFVRLATNHNLIEDSAIAVAPEMEVLVWVERRSRRVSASRPGQAWMACLIAAWVERSARSDLGFLAQARNRPVLEREPELEPLARLFSAAVAVSFFGRDCCVLGGPPW